MSKKSKRPGRATRDVHAAIREQATTLRNAPTLGIRDAEATPELAALMQSARCRIEAGLPSAFDHEGRTYYLRTSLVMQFDIFDTPGRSEPLMSGAVFSTESFGHAPGH